MTMLYVATYELTSRRMFKRVIYSFEFMLGPIILTAIAVWLLLMCFIGLLFDIPPTTIMLSRESIIKHVLGLTAISVATGIATAIVENKID
jgi:hypothetical protein